MQKPSWWVLWGLRLICCFVSFAAQAQVEVEGQSYTRVKDLKEEMLVYSESYETYVPYVKGTPFNTSAAVIVLNLRKYSDYQLYVQPPAEAALLINQRIVDYYWNGATALYPLDSLRSLYGDSCVVSIFHPALRPDNVEIGVIGRYPYSYTDTEKELDEYLSILERPRQSFTNFFIIGVLALMAMLAVLRNLYPRVFVSYYDLSRAVAIRVRDEANFTMKLSGRGHLPFIVFHSFLFGFLLMVLLQQVGKVGAAFSFLEASTFGGYLYAWLLLSGIVFFFQLLNYWLLHIVARIFNIPEFANIHFFDFLRLSQIFYTGLFILVTFLFFGAEAYVETGVVILLRIVAVFVLLRVLLIFFKLLHLSSFRKTYLFSYLCTTEILPLLIVLKFLLI